jgi:hypothetical protein
MTSEAHIMDFYLHKMGMLPTRRSTLQEQALRLAYRYAYACGYLGEQP